VLFEWPQSDRLSSLVNPFCVLYRMRSQAPLGIPIVMGTEALRSAFPNSNAVFEKGRMLRRHLASLRCLDEELEPAPLKVRQRDGVLENEPCRPGSLLSHEAPTGPAVLLDYGLEPGRIAAVDLFHSGVIAFEEQALSRELVANLLILVGHRKYFRFQCLVYLGHGANSIWCTVAVQDRAKQDGRDSTREGEPMKHRKTPMVLSPRFEEALTYASILHAGQVKKGTNVPYVSHVLMVAAIAMEYGGDEDEAIAALLHDAAEDAGGRARLSDIRNRFGENVADIVEGCTDTFDMPKPAWRPRKEAYVAHLTSAPPSVLLVSASDKVANVRAIMSDYREVGEQLWSRFTGGRDGTLWYYRRLADTLRTAAETTVDRSLERLTIELFYSVAELERLVDSSQS
jgi:hypothetical protein